MLKSNLRKFFVLLFVFALIGCASHGYQGLTEQETNLARFYSFYNTQYDDYVNMTKDPASLSEDQKTILRQKKKMLETLYPLIRLYDLQIQAQDPASYDTEQKIFDLLNTIQ